TVCPPSLPLAMTGLRTRTDPATRFLPPMPCRAEPLPEASCRRGLAHSPATLRSPGSSHRMRRALAGPRPGLRLRPGLLGGRRELRADAHRHGHRPEYRAAARRAAWSQPLTGLPWCKSVDLTVGRASHCCLRPEAAHTNWVVT